MTVLPETVQIPVEVFGTSPKVTVNPESEVAGSVTAPPGIEIPAGCAKVIV